MPAGFGETGNGPGQFLMAHSIYVDLSGGVFVADGKANRVQKFESMLGNRGISETVQPQLHKQTVPEYIL